MQQKAGNDGRGMGTYYATGLVPALIHDVVVRFRVSVAHTITDSTPPSYRYGAHRTSSRNQGKISSQ